VRRFPHEALCYRIRGCVFEVYRQLGAGFLERVYHRALLVELKRNRLRVRSDVDFPVHYKGVAIGRFRADLVVEDRVILELKAAKQITRACDAQLLNYLAASGIAVGFIVNFTYPRAAIKRLVAFESR